MISKRLIKCFTAKEYFQHKNLMTIMLVLYTHNTPNGHKISIALEELGLEFRVERVNIFVGEQFAANFTALSPNGKIPVLVDEEADVSVYESNAILLYLADKTQRLMPAGLKQRQEAMQLLFLQAASVGPMFGQRAYYVLFSPEAVPAAQARYTAEAERLERLLEQLLHDRDYFCGDYSIVDIAMLGWINTSVASFFSLDALPNLAGWFQRVASRPAVQKGLTIPDLLIDFTPLHDKAKADGRI